jgi:hypothetical protein
LSRPPRRPLREPPSCVGLGDGLWGEGFGTGVLAGEVEGLEVVALGEELATAWTCVSSAAGLGTGSGDSSFAPTMGAGASPLGISGSTAATGEELTASALANVTTVAKATVVITAAAVNLYTLVIGTAVLPGHGVGSRQRQPP